MPTQPKNSNTRRAPMRSISAPPWMEKNRGRKWREPSTTPIRNGEVSSPTSHSGTTTAAMKKLVVANRPMP